MHCTICNLPTVNIVGSTMPTCKCGWQNPNPPATKREWVGMTPTDMEELSATWWWPNENEMALIDWVESKLKEKNT